jgi:hypothetical protein
MFRRSFRRVRVTAALVGATAFALFVASSAAAQPAPAAGHYTGTLADGATWIADVPASWNGTLLLYSHGYGPLFAADAPDPNTAAQLLSMGYALAGSSYDPHGSWWALGSAVTDQFQTLSTVEQTVLKTTPSRVFAVGTSMGGLISALEDQNSNGRLDGALTTCGLIGGANNLNQYQLDGEYAIDQLLAGGSVQLTNFVDGPPSFADSGNAAAALTTAVTSAQTSAQGQARLALAFAFLNVSPWGGATQPSIYDFPGQELGQYTDYTTGLFGSPVNPITFIVEGREQIEAAAGGEGAGTVGVDFAQLLHQSSYYPEVKALYEDSGLSLSGDLSTLQSNANLKPDQAAYHWLAKTSVPSGRLQVPELDIHTISDPLIPVQQENYYAALVNRAGDSALLKQAFIQRQGHCAFTPAELIAALQALQTRVATGSWGSVATSGSLNAAAAALPAALGGGSFIPFWPEKLTGATYRPGFGASDNAPGRPGGHERGDRGDRAGHAGHSGHSGHSGHARHSHRR